MHEWRANARMTLCACACRSESVHFAHARADTPACQSLRYVHMQTCKNTVPRLFNTQSSAQCLYVEVHFERLFNLICSHGFCMKRCISQYNDPTRNRKEISPISFYLITFICSAFYRDSPRTPYGCLLVYTVARKGFFMQFADNAGPDQPAHLRRLISAFVARLRNQWMYVDEQKISRSDCMDAHAHANLDPHCSYVAFFPSYASYMYVDPAVPFYFLTCVII